MPEPIDQPVRAAALEIAPGVGTPSGDGLEGALARLDRLLARAVAAMQVSAHGTGLNVLFAGPPGTGKTMAAEVIAGALGLDLYTIDLSRVVSKYIGETERNLDRVFGTLESASAILFFDEADALFGKRTEVKDAHDRYAG